MSDETHVYIIALSLAEAEEINTKSPELRMRYAEAMAKAKEINTPKHLGYRVFSCERLEELTGL